MSSTLFRRMVTVRDEIPGAAVVPWPTRVQNIWQKPSGFMVCLPLDHGLLAEGDENDYSGKCPCFNFFQVMYLHTV